MSWATFWVSLAIVLGLLVAFNILFLFFHEHVLFQSEELDKDHKFAFDGPFEEIYIVPESKVQLHGLLFTTKNPKGLILYFHGNRGNLSRWGNIASRYTRFGYDVLVMDYRGYGKSFGDRSEEAIYQDAIRAYDHAATKLGYVEVVIFGRSLGSAIATFLATKRPAAQLILETPMTNIRAVVPTLNFLLINKSWFPYEFNSQSRMSAISCPITIIHGTSDAVVPYAMGVRLFDAISHSDKKLITIHQGKHNNLDNFGVYQQAMERILR